MDITQYTVNTDYGTEGAGLITFQGKTYTPEQVRDFIDALTEVAEEGERVLPEEETQEYKERQAYLEYDAYKTYARLFFNTPITRYQEVWAEDSDRREIWAEENDEAPNQDDMWRAQDGDRRTIIIASMREYEAKHGLTPVG